MHSTLSTLLIYCGGFEEFGLSEGVLRGVFAFGFEGPSYIQRRALIPIISGRDVIAQSQSGTGKTSMVAIASCNIVNVRRRELQVLVLSPTRELAQQTERLVLSIGSNSKIQAHACIGGRSISEDIHKLELGVHVVTGTPGRVFDMINRHVLEAR